MRTSLLSAVAAGCGCLTNVFRQALNLPTFNFIHLRFQQLVLHSTA